MGVGLRDLKVWQEAVALAADVTRTMSSDRRKRAKVLADRAVITAATMTELIAEAYSRFSPAEQRQTYRIAKRALLRLESQLAIARQTDMISAPSHAAMAARIQTVNRLLSGFLVYLDRELGTAASA